MAVPALIGGHLRPGRRQIVLAAFGMAVKPRQAAARTACGCGASIARLRERRIDPRCHPSLSFMAPVLYTVSAPV